MTPGALTPAERRAVVDHWHWCALNPRQPEDPGLRFTGDVLRRTTMRTEKAT